jgi:hypothetical protein
MPRVLLYESDVSTLESTTPPPPPDASPTVRERVHEFDMSMFLKKRREAKNKMIDLGYANDYAHHSEEKTICHINYIKKRCHNK